MSDNFAQIKLTKGIGLLNLKNINQGVKTSKNNEFVAMVIERNIVQTIENIRKNSPILQKMEKDGQIKIVGAYYDLKTGKVAF